MATPGERTERSQLQQCDPTGDAVALAVWREVGPDHEVAAACRGFYIWPDRDGCWHAKPLKRLSSGEMARGIPAEVTSNLLLGLASECAINRIRRYIYRHAVGMQR